MIRSYSEQLGISSRDMQVSNIYTVGSWWFAEYKQQVRGIQVKYSEIGFTIDPEGYIVTLGAYAFPDIKDVPSPQLSADDAVRIAQRLFGVENPEAIHEPKLKILPIIEQSYYSLSLTWEIRIFSMQPVKDIIYYVYARTESVLEEVNNIRHDTTHGTTTGSYWPESSNVKTATACFFSRIRVS